MTQTNNGDEGAPQSGGAPEPNNPGPQAVPMYDLRLCCHKPLNGSPGWVAWFEETNAHLYSDAWRGEPKANATLTGALAQAGAELLSAMALGEVKTRDK